MVLKFVIEMDKQIINEVTQRALRTLESADDEQETDAFSNEQQLFNEVEIEKFVLTFL